MLYLMQNMGMAWLSHDGVTDMIAEAVIGRKLETTGQEVLKTVHAPYHSEAVMEAVADAYDDEFTYKFTSYSNYFFRFRINIFKFSTEFKIMRVITSAICFFRVLFYLGFFSVELKRIPYQRNKVPKYQIILVKFLLKNKIKWYKDKRLANTMKQNFS